MYQSSFRGQFDLICLDFETEKYFLVTGKNDQSVQSVTGHHNIATVTHIHPDHSIIIHTPNQCLSRCTQHLLVNDQYTNNTFHTWKSELCLHICTQNLVK